MEAYAPGTPIFALPGNDILTGGSRPNGPAGREFIDDVMDAVAVLQDIADASFKTQDRVARRLDMLEARVETLIANGGIEPAMIEIVAKDGTTFRVYGDKAAAGTTQEVASAKEWDAEIEKLKAKATPKTK